MERGKRFSPDVVNNSCYTQKSVGLHPGFGSSPFGICITELVDGLVNVLYAEEFARADFNVMIETTLSLLDQYGISFDNRCRVLVDGANPSFIRALKNRIYGEEPDYELFISRLKTSYGPARFNLESLMHNMFVVPVHFNKEHKSMLAHTKELMEYNNGNVAIHPRFNKLITALRTAVENGEGVLDKEATSHDDLFDSFRLSLQFYR